MHFGALANPSPSHLAAIVSLGHELQSRGHRFTLFGEPDLAGIAERSGISALALDNGRNYLPSATSFVAGLGSGLSYREMVRYGIGEMALYCERAPKSMEAEGVQCLIADQLVAVARTVAERLNVPLVTICCSIPNSTDPDLPPSPMPWRYKPVWWARCRNRLMYSAMALFSIPVSRRLNAYRHQWGLPPHRKLDDTFSPLAQVTQLVREFDFPFRKPPANLHYVGPYHREDDQHVEFPYDRLDGRPLIFAVLGRLLGTTPGIWQTIAESCLGLDAQLVISLGGRGKIEDYRDLPGQPLVVAFAPQCELLKRVTLMITHGGLNSVMETLNRGVPMISLPAFGADQPGVAMRVAASGAGEILPLNRCRTEMLRPLVKRVFSHASYKAHALVLKKAIQKTRGIEDAADIAERVSQLKC
jgi:zeaxanthin glucosyltransferase